MSEENIKKALEDAGITEMISCDFAFEATEKAKVYRGAIGEYCNDHRIKIRSCQLGYHK